MRASSTTVRSPSNRAGVSSIDSIRSAACSATPASATSNPASANTSGSSARRSPVHLLAPWTPEGLGAIADTPLGPAIPRWVARASPPGAGSDTVTGIVAGALPWHALQVSLEPEYLGEVSAAPVPAWVAAAAQDVGEGTAPGFTMVPEGPLRFVAPPTGVSADVRRTLGQLGATALAPSEVEALAGGVVLWFCEGAGVLPPELSRCPPTTRVIVLPGPDGAFDPSWMHADLVVPGPWERAVARLHEPLWRAALA